MKRDAVFNLLLKIIPKLKQKLKSKDALKNRIFKSSFWSILGNSFYRGMSILSLIIVARIINKEEYGQYGMLYSTLAMFQIFAALRMGMTATKHISEYRNKNSVLYKHIYMLSLYITLISSLILGFILFIYSNYISVHVLNAPQLSLPLKIATIALIFSSLNSVQNGALIGFEAFKTISVVNFILGIYSMVAMLVGSTYGVVGLVTALASQHLLHSLINFSILHLKYKMFSHFLSFRNIFNNWGILISFSLPTILSGVVPQSVVWLCQVMLGNQPDGYGELGIYSAAFQWYLIVIFIPMFITRAIYPILSERYNSSDFAGTKKTLKTGMTYILMYALPASILIILLSKYIASFYGAGYEEVYKTIMITASTAVVLGVQMPLSYFLNASGKTWPELFINILWGGACILIALFSVKYGAIGLASAFLISYIFRFFMLLSSFIIYVKVKNAHEA